MANNNGQESDVTTKDLEKNLVSEDENVTGRGATKRTSQLLNQINRTKEANLEFDKRRSSQMTDFAGF